MKKLTCILLFFACAGLKAQQRPVVVNHGLKPIIAALDTLRDHLPIEKLYLQTDKPYYTLGDTLWFKSYLLNADYLTPSLKSGMLYVELDDAGNHMIKRIMVQVTSGISWGNIILNAEDVSEGSYTLRAYTNWMRNFGEDYIFKKKIYISALSGSTLIKASFKLDSIAGKNKVTADLIFANLNKNPIRLKDMQLKVINGNHNLFKDKATTGMDGSLKIDFDLADKTQLNNLSIIVNQTGKDITDTATLTIPVTINRPENTDVQFMPEGGNLVAGIPTRVGFKAISEDGNGTDVNGRIINSKNQTITTIQALHKGMGSFEFTPETGESYTAVIDLPNKTTKSYPLPKVNPAGTALRITGKGDDSLEVVLSLKSEVKSPASTQDFGLKTSDLNNYYLIGQSRGVVCYAASINFKQPVISKILAKSLFPTGIVRFTLLNQSNQPINERIVYIDHHDNLNISINSNKPGHATRDSIALNIQVKDKDGNPVHGTFGLAVTDNNQVKPDSMGSNIINDLLLTSDLKGTVEEPGWYFDPDSPDSYRDRDNNKAIALDNLLLTQGWVGYNWKDIFQAKPAPIQFPAEKEFIIQGKVTNVFNKPVETSQVVLMGKKPVVVRDTLTGKDGIFTFKKLFPIDTAEFKIEARNKNGKEFNVGIDMLNEFKGPVFTAGKLMSPWYVNSDTTLLNNGITRTAQLKAEADYRGEGHLLKEVKINEKKIIPGSHNLNGPGEADQIIDEKDLLKAGKMTLGELLEKQVKRFQVKGIWTFSPPASIKHIPYFTSYLIAGDLIGFIFDGIPLSAPIPTNQGHDDRYDALKPYMDYSAEDIKGIEVLFNSKYSSLYKEKFFSNPSEQSEFIFPACFIEITTRAGHGPVIKNPPGTYLYKPLPYTLPKQFYRPRYTVRNKNIAPGTDLRSNIHWEPNVITDKDGKATVSFFSADKPADYSVIMEGTDLKGNLGYQKEKIKKEVSIPIVQTIDSLRNRLPIEKLYLQTDKPYYTLGDTIWFKSYLLNADYLTPSIKNSLLYVELDNTNNQPVKRMMVPVSSGLSWGNIALNAEEVPEGSYTLRAYTNWMRNFGEDYIFKKNIYITASNSRSTLVKADFRLDSIAGKNQVQANLRFTNLNKDPLRLKNMQLKVVNGTHDLLKDKINTGMDGNVDLNFDLTDKKLVKNLAIQAQQTGKDADTTTLTIPLILNRPGNTDLQFMPEGGNLVAGIKTKIGFKAIAEDGKGTDITGKIIDSKKKEITRFQSTHKGMGCFELMPEAGETYTAVIDLPDRTTKSYSLPVVSTAGTALRITNKDDDSLEVTISNTTNNTTYYLVGQSKGAVCYTATIKANQAPIIRTISEKLFPTGIARFTLLNQNNQPLNERIVYIDHKDNLRVSITPTQKKYGLRDSIALEVRVADKAGNPVQGDFSIAVTDDNQVKPDSTASNILNNLLFTSDLKGVVEEPGWYFDPSNHPDSALDNLLLTQGWVGYSWQEVFDARSKRPEYVAEKEFTIKGKLTNIFNKPVKKTDVSLLQKKPFLTMNTSSDDEGRFVFKDRRLFPSDTAYYLLQVKNKNGEGMNVGINVDDFIPPVFAPLKEQISPWYINSDTVLLNNNSTKTAQLKATASYLGDGHMLKAVTINDKKLIPGSRNPYPAVQVSIVLDENDMNAAKKMSLFELLQHRYKDFYKSTEGYFLNTRKVVLIIDGQGVGPTDLYMDYLTAEDIRGIEVVYKITKFRYDLALTYITTYSGKGGLLKHSPGSYVYKPLGPGPAKEFYRPRYTVKNSNVAIGTDLRSTIHWEPNVITDKNGKATVSFFSADKPSNYTVIMEGTDLNGDLGYQRKKIKVVSPTTASK